MSDESQLDGLIERLRKLDGVGVAIAEAALPAVLEASRATASSGTAPDGTAWQPRKDGSAALVNASAAISAVVSGSSRAVITLILKAPYVFHQLSKNKSTKTGLPRREILSVDDVPAPIVEAIQSAARRVITRSLGGRT